MKYLFFSILMLLSLTVMAQSPVGTWKTVDDDSGDARSYVKIYEQAGRLYGKITKLLNQDSNTKCDLCAGKKKNAPVVGLVIIEDMQPAGTAWVKGQILDPENGKEYTCELWMEDAI
ncbi:MAG: DUF2147 domain-containing protein [Bacteroidota bacterium]